MESKLAKCQGSYEVQCCYTITMKLSVQETKGGLSTEVHTTCELLPKYNNVCKCHKEVTRSLKEIILNKLYFRFLGNLELLHVTLTE